MRQPKRKQLSVDEIRVMTSDGTWIKDDALLQRVRDASTHPEMYAAVYKQTNSDQTIIETTYHRGTLQRLELLEQFIHAMQQPMDMTPKHSLDGLIPYGKDFPNHAVELAESLAGLFEVPPESLDFSYESFKVVDEGLTTLQYGQECMDPPMFAALVAYWGEVIRRRTNGRWIMRQVQESPPVWNPILRTETGEMVEVAYMFSKAFDDGEGFTLYEEWRVDD